jgi:hypothetical protein
VVALRAISFNVSTFWPQGVFMFFVCITGKAAITSITSIRQLVFITEAGCAYCAVQTQTLNMVQLSFALSRANVHEAIMEI